MKLSEMVQKQLNENNEKLLGLKDFEYLDYSPIKNAHYLTATDSQSDDKVIIKKSGSMVWAKTLEGERWQLITDNFTVKEA